MKPRFNYEISNSTRRKSENGEFGVKVGLEGGEGARREKVENKTRRGTRTIVWRQRPFLLGGRWWRR